MSTAPITINPAEHAKRLTTSLNRLKAAGACTERYRHLVRALGGASFDHDAPINILKILELNGAEDAIWALRAVEQDCDTIARLFAADCAEDVLPLFEREYPDDGRPRAAIEAARLFTLGRIGEVALDAAWDAASAASAAARDARAAAWAAARDAQGDLLRHYLLPDVPLTGGEAA